LSAHRLSFSRAHFEGSSLFVHRRDYQADVAVSRRTGRRTWWMRTETLLSNSPNCFRTKSKSSSPELLEKPTTTCSSNSGRSSTKLSVRTREVQSILKCVSYPFPLSCCVLSKLISSSCTVAYLLRLRQIACDPTLCPPDFIEMYVSPFLSSIKPVLTRKRFNRIRDEAQADHLQDEFKKVSGTDGSEEQMTYLRRLLHQLDEEECSICSSLVVDARISICQHIFCQSWSAPSFSSAYSRLR